MGPSPSRKRLRRSTRTCYQCRKRKVKCQLTVQDVETCAECIKTGARCTLEQPEAETGETGSSDVQSEMLDGASRLDRIESLLTRLVEAQGEQCRAASNPSGSEPAVRFPDLFWDGAPLDNGGVPLINSRLKARSSELEASDARSSLLALLPSEQDAVFIVTNTTAWLWGAETPTGTVLKASDGVELLQVAKVSEGSAIHIAKALLLFALYMQQLPGHFDVQLLESQDVDRAISVIVTRVRSFILTHDDEACSLDGIECLTLLSLLHLNDGALRKAWTTFRRTLDMAQLQHLQRSFSQSVRRSTVTDGSLRRRLWLSTVCGDCYCSMLLGLEPACGVAPFGTADDGGWSSDAPADGDDTDVQRRICLIVARIARRNSTGLQRDRRWLRDIDGALNRLQDSLGAPWWRTPSFRRDRPLDSAEEPNRLMCQMWFHLAHVYAHIPVALGEAADDSLASLQSCMEACRVTLQRYLSLGHARDQLSRCRAVDQAAFVAAVVLALTKVHARGHDACAGPRYDSDRALLEHMADWFGAVGSTSSRERVMRQCHRILSVMLGAMDLSKDDFHSSETECRGSSDAWAETCVDYGHKHAAGMHLGRETSEMQEIIDGSIRPAVAKDSPALGLLEAATMSMPSAASGQTIHHLSAGASIDPVVLQ